TLTVISDISKRKAAEQAVRELSSRLLHMRDEEQRRIARELHDSTGQNLAALAMDLTRIQKESGALGPKALEALSECLVLADQCCREVRDMAELLHPPLLDEIGLASALEWNAEAFTRRTGISVELTIPSDIGRLGQDVETALFRIAQECLSNINRHSGSSKA